MLSPRPFMAPKDRCLSTSQARSVKAILEDEFGPHVLDKDADFAGYGAVSPWAFERITQIFEHDPLFTNNIVKADQQAYRRVRNSG